MAAYYLIVWLFYTKMYLTNLLLLAFSWFQIFAFMKNVRMNVFVLGRKIDIAAREGEAKVQGTNLPVRGCHLKTTNALEGGKFLVCWDQAKLVKPPLIIISLK